uniref:KIB1-4 beta-propeller domain-containing protein n=1 Tax=Oryza punctata TaxID=4537 RepID=A0A0E0LHR4_ORYPU
MASGGTAEQGGFCWASLPAELAELIAARVLAAGGFVDYVRFRAVCSPWPAAAACWTLASTPAGGLRPLPGPPRSRRPRPLPRPLRLLRRRTHPRPPSAPLRPLLLDSPDGLLLQRDGDTAIRLLHPFTGDIAEFPHLDSLAHQLLYLDFDPTVDPMYIFTGWMYNTSAIRFSHQIRKICAAVDVADEGIVTVMLAVEKIGRVAFAAAGDNDWVISTWKENQLDKALSFQGKLYVVNCRDGLIHVSVIDPPVPRRWRHEGEESVAKSPVPPPRRIVTCSSEEIHLPSLVELDSQIMLVGYNDTSLSRILVLRLADLAMGMIVPVVSIGDHILFIGARSLCVSSGWLPSIGGNSIVCFHAGENYLAQYHLGTGSWSPASDGQLMLSPPSRPCSLIHHIFTCCYRQFWNKGRYFVPSQSLNGGRCRSTDLKDS